MQKIKKNERGFGTIKLLSIVVVIALIGVGGWLIYDRATTTVTPYAGWKTYTLKYEKTTFRFPPTWQLKDNSFTSSSNAGGNDSLLLTGTNGFEMNIADGGPDVYGFPVGWLTSVSAVAITFLGQQAYMNLATTASSNNGIVDHINLTTTKTSLTSFPVGKNVIAPYSNNETQNKILITMDYYANVDKSSPTSIYPTYPLATVLKDTSYLNAKLVISSFKY